MSDGQGTLPMSWPGQPGVVPAPGPNGLGMQPGQPLVPPGYGGAPTALPPGVQAPQVPPFFGTTPPDWTGGTAADAVAAAEAQQAQQQTAGAPVGAQTGTPPVDADAEELVKKAKREQAFKKAKAAAEKLARRDWSTPQDRFNAWHAEFQFTLDGAANAGNTKVPGRFIGPGSPFGPQFYDALSVPALPGESLWVNSPGFSEDFVKWGWQLMGHQDPRMRPRCIVQIRPNNQTEQPFWQEFIEQYRDLNGLGMLQPLGIDFRIRFLTPRVEFIPPPPTTFEFEGQKHTLEIKESGPRSGHVLLIWRNLFQYGPPQHTSQG